MQKSSSGAITVFGKPECPDYARARRVLDAEGIAFEFHDILSSDEDRAFAAEISGGAATPVLLFADGSIQVEPTEEVLRGHLRERGYSVSEAGEPDSGADADFCSVPGL
jgi:glutaredoxin